MIERYPAGVPVTVDDLERSGWREIAAAAARERYSSMWTAFSKAAAAAKEAGDIPRAKVLWLLADAMSLQLIPNSPNQPFKPIALLVDRRSAITDDFTAEDIEFFAAAVPLVDDPKVQARLADLVWVLKKNPRRPDLALTAVEAYRKLPLTEKAWVHDGQGAWSRALFLAHTLGKAGAQVAEELEQSLHIAVDSGTVQQRFFPLQVAQLMRAHRLKAQERDMVAQTLERLANEADSTGDVLLARPYYREAAQWYRDGKDGLAAARVTAAEAECWAKEGDLRSASGNAPGHIVAASLYENAIQTYRTVPRKQRASFRVEERIEELRAKLTSAGEGSVDGMMMVRTPGVDIAEIAQRARDAVAGKSAIDALREFASLYGGPNPQQLRDSVLENFRKYPFQGLFGSTMISREGRVIAKQPGLGLNAELTESDENAIWAAMVRDYQIEVALVVQGQIIPAMHLLGLEHRFVEGDFVELARSSPLVPKARAALVGKGLFAGFDGDMITAVHLLTPQLENLVRHHLKSAGAITSTLSPEGIETENGLSTLMALPEAKQVYGERFCFEVRAIFCSAFGPNIRNELAHGLLEEGACNSVSSVYAWWFMFRIVFANFWNSRHASGELRDTESSPDNGEAQN